MAKGKGKGKSRSSNNTVIKVAPGKRAKRGAGHAARAAPPTRVAGLGVWAPPISTGSVCTGLGLDMMAWEEPELKDLPVVHQFACDKDTHNQTFLQNNFKLQALFVKANAEFHASAPPCDVFSAGFPCQGFSVAGKHGALADARSSVIFDIINYWQKHVPRLVILENVKGLVELHPEALLMILKRLKAIKNKSDATPA